MFKKNKKILNDKGEAYVGEATKIVICIVLGALIIAGLVLMTNKLVIPKTEQWFVRMFGASNGYIGQMYDQTEYGGDITREAMFLLGSTESSFYQKYKNDVDYGGHIVGNFTASLYSDIDREEIKEWCENTIANPSSTAKEKQFAQDWLTEYDGIGFLNVDKRYAACSKELSYLVMQRDRNIITEEQMVEEIVACANRHGFDGEAIREIL